MDQEEGMVERFSKGSLAILFGTASGRLIGALYSLVIVRGLDPRSYGILSLMTVSVSLAWAAINTHVSLATAKHLAAEKTDYRLISSCFWYHIVVGLIFGTLTVVFGGWVAEEIFHVTKVDIIFQIGGLLLFGMSLQAAFSAIFLGYLRVHYRTIVNTCKQISLLIFTILFLELGWSLMGVLAALAISELLGLLYAWLLTKRIIPTATLTKYFDASTLRKLLAFGMILYLTTFLEQIGDSASVYSLGVFKSQTSIGEYEAAVGLSGLLTIIPSSISVPLMPAIADRFRKKGKSGLETATNYSLRYTLYGVLPLTLLTYIFSEVLIFTLYGKKYVGSIPILQIVVFADLFQSVALIFQSIFIGLGNPVSCLKYALVTTLVSCASNLVLTERFDAKGTAVAYLITSMSGLVLSILLYVRTTSNRIPKMPYIKAIAISILSCIPAFMMKSSVPYLALLQFVFSLGLYVLMLVVFRGLGEEDFNVLSRVSYLRPIVNLAKKITRLVSKLSAYVSDS